MPTRYEIAVVGAGPAGIMAAITASRSGYNIILLERNNDIGRKLLLTGNGRCNLTNRALPGEFVRKFERRGNFLKKAFFEFTEKDLEQFFASSGLHLKAEKDGRVFPVTDKASSVVDILKRRLKESAVDVRYNERLLKLHAEKGIFILECKSGLMIEATKVIIATGGASYSATGSSGDGFDIARSLSHSIVPLKPALVPLKVEEKWVSSLKGLAFENARISIIDHDGKKKLYGLGDILFTHFGVSGPLVLDLSFRIISLIKGPAAKIPIFIDFKPDLTADKVEDMLLEEFKSHGKTRVYNIMKKLLPSRFVDIILNLSGIDPAREACRITRKERSSIVGFLKNFPLHITGPLSLEEAMVTDGGVSTAEIDSGAMSSKLVSGLYFAGEIIDGRGPSGGYNLQQAFSTGYLAGKSAALALSRGEH